MKKLLFYYVCVFSFHIVCVQMRFSPEQALEKLRQGNNRLLRTSKVCMRLDKKTRGSLVEMQKPYAVVVTCSDSRVPPELIFNQQLGDLFVVRSAGPTLQETDIGSIEYGVKYLGASIVVVLGHKNCGAVQATLAFLKSQQLHSNHIQSVIDAITPALSAKEDYQGAAGLRKAVITYVQYLTKRLANTKPLLNKYSKAGTLKIVGAYYDLVTGKVTFLP
jgi:carbonic anhydrase